MRRFLSSAIFWADGFEWIHRVDAWWYPYLADWRRIRPQVMLWACCNCGYLEVVTYPED